MLSWTAAGAVPSPRTLQVRVQPAFRGIAAGAPRPSTPLDDEELLRNLRHFTEGRRGPRTLPVHTLVLSGVAPTRAAGVARAVEEGRGLGLTRVVLHAEHQRLPAITGSPLGALVDATVLRVRRPEQAEALTSLPGEAHAVIVLDDELLADPGPLLRAVLSRRPARVTLSWPFPGAAVPPPAARVVEALRPHLDDLAGPWGLKGLPLCALLALRGVVHDLHERVWRSGNRFYVDADHQLDEALVFFPDVVRFAKRDACRFCTVDGRCDGVAAEWLAQGLAGPLIPVR
jgi:hypothetical protein